MRVTASALVLLITFLSAACGGPAGQADSSALTDAEKVWCLDRAMNGMNRPDGDLVDRAALNLNLVPGAKTTEDVRTHWADIGFGDANTPMADWAFRKDPSYIRACKAAFEAAR